MSGPVRLLAGDGQVRVGAATFPGGPLPDGRVGLLGVALRRLGLTERDQLVALAEDDARTLARLVGGAACDTALPDDDRAAAAIEAVALDLAGATHDGPLARTRVLAARAGATSLAASDADDLADELARAVEQDDGWTRLVLAGGPDDEAGEPAEVRDRLARALLDRARQPLDAALVQSLLRERADPDDVVHRPTRRLDDDAHAPAHAGTVPSPVWTAAPPEPGATPSAPTHGRPAVIDGGGLVAEGPSVAVVRAADAPARPVPAPVTTIPTGVLGRGSDPASGDVGTLASHVVAPPTSTPAGWRPGTTLDVPPADLTRPAADRWGAPVAVTTSPRAAVASGARSPWSTPRPPATGGAPAWSPSSPLVAPAALGGRPSVATSPPGSSAPAAPRAVTSPASVDDVALALHRAADLRGVRR